MTTGARSVGWTVFSGAGFALSETDSEQLSQRSGVWARFVDSYRPGASDPLLGDQAAAGESVDFSHHRGGIDVEGTGEIRQCSLLIPVEEQLDEQATLRVAAKHGQGLLILHRAQYIMHIAQNT